MKRYLLVDVNAEVLGDFDEIDDARDYAKAYVGEDGWPSELTLEDDSDGIVEGWENGDDSQEVLIFDTIRLAA